MEKKLPDDRDKGPETTFSFPLNCCWRTYLFIYSAKQRHAEVWKQLSFVTMILKAIDHLQDVSHGIKNKK